jgi:hypothetical protein
MTTLDFIVDAQDVLSYQMGEIMGGIYDDQEEPIECKNDGIIFNCTDGPTPSQGLAVASFSIL